jgi:hypothetical protein
VQKFGLRRDTYFYNGGLIETTREVVQIHKLAEILGPEREYFEFLKMVINSQKNRLEDREGDKDYQKAIIWTRIQWRGGITKCRRSAYETGSNRIL